MNSLHKGTFALIILVIGLTFNSCKKSETESRPDIQPVDVCIEVLRPSKLVDILQVAGIVKALEDASISPEEGGVVKDWVARRGQYVEKGDIILLLKDEVVKASFDAADAQYKIAELNVEKQKIVFDQQGISELQYKSLLYTRDAAKANADLMKARLERTKIQSPINGVVDNIIPNKGEFAPPGVPIARVVNISVVKIQAEIPEKISGSVSFGDPAIITFDALPGDTLRGKVSFIGATVSSANRTLTIEIIIRNPYRKLKPEMIGKVKLLRATKDKAILIDEALVQLVDRDRRIVYTEIEGKAKECLVEIGGRQGNRVEVISGLKAGDHVIVAGYQKLVNGLPVIVTQ